MLNARPFTAADWVAYQGWHSDRELSRRASFPDEAWFNYVTAPSVEHSIVAFENSAGEFMSLAQFDIENGALILFIAVDPARRGHGLGRQTLDAIISSAPLTVTSVDAQIESNNEASIQMARSAGFIPLQNAPDKDGFVHWRFTL